MTTSIHQIVDEFFSLKNLLISPAYAQISTGVETGDESGNTDVLIANPPGEGGHGGGTTGGTGGTGGTTGGGHGTEPGGTGHSPGPAPVAGDGELPAEAISADPGGPPSPSPVTEVTPPTPDIVAPSPIEPEDVSPSPVTEVTPPIPEVVSPSPVTEVTPDTVAPSPVTEASPDTVAPSPVTEAFPDTVTPSPVTEAFPDTVTPGPSPCVDPPPWPPTDADSLPDSPAGQRWPDIDYKKAVPIDTRYRDMCIAGAKLDQGEFNLTTGQVKADDIDTAPTPSPGPVTLPPPPTPYVPDWTAFHQKYVGKVSGSKPERTHCMPLRDTPKADTSYNAFTPTSNPAAPNLAFTYYLNMDDWGFKNNIKDIYKQSNFYKSKTFFVGGDDPLLACPDLLEPTTPFPDSPASIPERAEFQRMRARHCYDYYILNHAEFPWFAVEIPGQSTDDPLSLFDKHRTFLNSCQPLVSGNRAGEILMAQWKQSAGSLMPTEQTPSDIEKISGFSPVWRYNGRADGDEAEYWLSTYLQKTWNDNFVSAPKNDHLTLQLKSQKLKDFKKATLPCIQKWDDSVITPSISYEPDNVGSVITPDVHVKICPGPSPSPTTGVTPPLDPGICIQFPIPKDYIYKSPEFNKSEDYYCPNVEKITEPSHPFSPRQHMSNNAILFTATDYIHHPQAKDFFFYQNPAYQYPPIINETKTLFEDKEHHLTDRDYSWETSTCVPRCPPLKPRRGYSPWIPVPPYFCDPAEPKYFGLYYDADTGDINTHSQIMYPIVQCAQVPVDVLEFRKDAFDSCIMQRINHNYNEWIKAGYPKPTEFNPPCKTRYFETDTFSECPVKMSIQQCCNIIVKDVVPANFLKLRTCEGLLQTRREDTDLQNDMATLLAPPGGGTWVPPKITYLTNKPIPGDLSYLGQLGAFNIGGFDFETARKATARLNNIDQCGGNMDPINEWPESHSKTKEPKEYLFKNYFAPFYNPVPAATDPIFCPVGPCTGWALMGYHMPYMRWWDTGVSAGNPYHGGSYVNTLGSYDVILGVGREERDKKFGEIMHDTVESAETTIGGSGSIEDESGPLKDRLEKEQPSEMGRVGGWSELKAHQMWSIRRNNLFCIGRYEKLIKPGGPEQLTLSKAGSGYTSQAHLQWPWPLGWRGYATDTHDKEFPNYPSDAPAGAALTGLDNALPGDIIMYDINGLTQLAYVTDIGFDVKDMNTACFDYNTNKFKKGGSPPTCSGGTELKPNRVFVVAWDQGKFPTSTGSTLNWGMGPERSIYKGAVPENYSKEICNHKYRSLTHYTKIKEDGSIESTKGDPECRDVTNKDLDCADKHCQPSCEDSNYNACVLPKGVTDWNNAKIYRPSQDVRQCQDGTMVGVSGTNFDLTKTYQWTGLNSADPLKPLPADKKVVYQGLSQKVGTDFWSYCVNAGYDPPAHWNKEYKGAQTGAITDATLCGPLWNQCAKPPDAKTKFSPK